MNQLKVKLDEAVLNQLLLLIYKQMGIFMNDHRKVCFETRLIKHLHHLGDMSLKEYLNKISEDVNERQNLFDLATTNDTYFFRTPRIWQYLNEEFLPAWYYANPDFIFKIWSAATSTGEEAYSLAICCEEFKAKHPHFNYLIQSSDINAKVLDCARKGTYQARSVKNFQELYPEWFKKYLIKKDNSFEVKPQLKQKIQFSLHNLLEKSYKDQFFELIMIRNVLIYFDQAMQEKVINNLAASLNYCGQLIIGESESITHLNMPLKFKMPLIYGW